MSCSVNRVTWARALVVIGLVYGSFYVLYQRTDWAGPGSDVGELDLPPLAVSPAAGHNAPRPGHPHHSKPAHQAAIDKLWEPSQLDPSLHSNDANAWKDHNAQTMHNLFACLASESCTEHQDKVVILEENDYREAFLDKTPGGERIFARSVITTFDVLGVTYLFTLGPGHLAFYYSMFPNLIKAVIMHDEDVLDCWADEGESDCLKTSQNPHGVPIHHLFMPNFFGARGHTPFGPEWALTPEQYAWGDQAVDSHGTYLGYSIESDCMKTKLPAHADKPRRVWILAKHAHYFEDISPTFFSRASAALNVEFVSAFDLDTDHPIPLNITNLGHGGPLSKPQFEAEIINSLAIVGLGEPPVSPTPWYGLCWSLPFLNPTIYRDDGSIENSQHSPAAKIGPPHVFDYPRPSKEGTEEMEEKFVDALRAAIDGEGRNRERFIAPEMTQRRMNERTLQWLERDWKGLVEERMQLDEYREKWAGKDFLL